MEAITMCFTCIHSLSPHNNHTHKIYSYPILQMKKLRQREYITCPRPHHLFESLKPTALDVLRSLLTLIILLLVALNKMGTSNSSVGSSQLLSAERLCLRQGQARSWDSSHLWRGCT